MKQNSNGPDALKTSPGTKEADSCRLPHTSANSVVSFVHPNENPITQYKLKPVCISLVHGLAKLVVGGYYLTYR